MFITQAVIRAGGGGGGGELQCKGGGVLVLNCESIPKRYQDPVCASDLKCFSL